MAPAALLVVAIAFPTSRIPRILEIGLMADLILAAPVIYLGMQRMKSTESAPDVAFA